jgi:hypothetical protein
MTKTSSFFSVELDKRILVQATGPIATTQQKGGPVRTGPPLAEA